MTEFWVSFILKFSPFDWKTCEKCQNFNHHKIDEANHFAQIASFQSYKCWMGYMDIYIPEE
jgi:hypothetical protein